MPVSTINTNIGSYAALGNLRTIQEQLDAVTKQVSTGYIVADALDNGAVFGVAQSVRAQISGSIASNQELGNFIGTVQTTAAASTGISNTLSEIRAVLTHIANPFQDKISLEQYQEQFASLCESLITYRNSGNYNGTNLLSTNNSLSVLQDAQGTLLIINGRDYNIASALSGILTGGTGVNVLASNASVVANSTNAASCLMQNGVFLTVVGSVSSVLNRIGALNNRTSMQQDFNTTVQNALSTGLGSLVDADMAADSARLTALQVKQQLATQSLSIANQNPNTLLKLFQ
ncbi:MAG: flagellin [Alphaproteobacteria bacterium]|nr:flagellin [Alphaproteobacteria bacterium]